MEFDPMSVCQWNVNRTPQATNTQIGTRSNDCLRVKSSSVMGSIFLSVSEGTTGSKCWIGAVTSVFGKPKRGQHARQHAHSNTKFYGISISLSLISDEALRHTVPGNPREANTEILHNSTFLRQGLGPLPLWDSACSLSAVPAIVFGFVRPSRIPIQREIR